MALVLVVDDEYTITSLLREVLEEEGHTVLTAHDGQQALDLARAHPPDVVLTDHMMPRLTGLELAQILLTDLPVPHPAILVMSAAHLPDLSLLAPVTVLSKPFAIDTVVALVAACTSLQT